MGGFTFAQVLVLIIATASMLVVSTANRGGPHWPFRGHDHRFHQPKCEDQGPKKIIVGGSEQWRFNFTYTDWALKNGPFFINDTLGELTNDSNIIPCSIYRLSECIIWFHWHV